MTSASSAVRPSRTAQLGTLALLAWSGPHPEEDRDVAFLMAYSLGDGEGGPEGVEAAARELLDEIGMPAGTVGDAEQGATMPITLLLEGGQVSLTMPQLKVQCATPPEWMAAAQAEDAAHFIFATRAWPEAVPGRPVTEDMLRAFAGDEETLVGAGHCVLPVRRLRK
ncbi:DUF5949 family protein [Streptomyces melanogenes]|uniref:DUF5949 family protein n=1 Tax=Streptomyces melanogenes TaxID=67326 RepID=A0ABZ1XYV8_9ACTN|nr:DUF5949 family protein [Streptomyces melanogenes]